MTCESETLNLKNSQTDHLHVNVQRHRLDKEKETMELCISNSEKVKEYAKRFSQGHWTCFGPGDEKKWYGTLSYIPEGKWDCTATQVVERFNDTGHPVFKSISALNRAILKQQNIRDIIHFNADASNTELLFRIIHSVCKSAQYLRSSFELCEQFGLTEEEKVQERPLGKKESVSKGVLIREKSQEVNLLVSSPRLASGSSLRENIQDFESLSETIRFTRVCEDAIFRASGFSWYELQNQT